MTIDEAIKHCKEVAEENESKADRIEQLHLSGNAEGCRECASDHQQLAEWLKELKQLREQEPCEDAISRQAVLDGIVIIAKAKAKSDAQKSLMGRVMFFTEHLPSATPQPKMGKWSHDGSHWANRFICSECGYKLFEEQTKYCPNCGAKMAERSGEDADSY